MHIVMYTHIIHISYTHILHLQIGRTNEQPSLAVLGRRRSLNRKTESIHHHHHHLEGVVYRSFCLDYSTIAVSYIVSRRWRSIESLFSSIKVKAIPRAKRRQLSLFYPLPAPPPRNRNKTNN